MKRSLIIACLLTCTLISSGFAQLHYQTVLEDHVLQSLIDETSGALQMHHIMELGGYPHDRKPDEYAGTYYESQYIHDKAVEYGFSDVQIMRWPAMESLWDGEVGELWILEPEERLFLSYRDITTALAPNSVSGEYEGELIFIGDGSSDSDYEGKEIEGNFVLTSGSPRRMYNKAVKEYKAAGILSYSVPGHPFQFPDKIGWNSLPSARGFMGMGRQDTLPQPKAFGFNLSPRMGEALRQKLSRLQNGKLRMRAVVKAEEREVDNELVTAMIPGDGSSDEILVLSAHLFEGVQKQGASDNVSGCASILEAGRAIIRLIETGKISRPARNLRFLWVPEMSGSFQYLAKFPDRTKRTVANINLDMVGEDVHKNLNSLRVHQSLKAWAHCIDDITGSLFDWMGSICLEDAPRGGAVSHIGPVIDPMGSQVPFYYEVMPYTSGSDHIVFQIQDFGIPAVFFNNWPDMGYHTSHDRPDMSDATQLKRSAILAAGIAIATGGGKESDLVRIGSECYRRSMMRIQNKTTDELKTLAGLADSVMSQRYGQARYILAGQTAIEKQSIGTLAMFTGNQTKQYVSTLLKGIDRTSNAALKDLDAGYRAVCNNKGVQSVKPSKSQLEKTMARWMPAYVPKDPLTEKDAMKLWAMFMGGGIRVPGVSRFAGTEIRNTINGKRSALEVYNRVCAEFGPMPMEAVQQYLEKLEETEEITIRK